MTRVVFMGSCGFAAGIFHGLLSLQGFFHIVGAYTVAPKVQGRGCDVKKSPVHMKAEEEGIPVFTPSTLKTEEEICHLKNLDPHLIVVASYGFILPKIFLSIPPLGCINVHPSLLPSWRGASPMIFTILSGEKETGVSIMLMDAGMDTGPILVQSRRAVPAHITTPELSVLLQEDAVELLRDILPRHCAHAMQGHPQPSHGATYTTKIQKKDGALQWKKAAQVLEREIRAFQPWPSSWFLWKKRRVQVMQACVREATMPSLPAIGTVILHEDGTMGIVCGDGYLLCPLVVKPEGKRIMDIGSFLRGYPMESLCLEEE